MAGIPEIGTARLRLRAWRDEDRDPFAGLNADPEVMEHFPKTLSREESDLLVDAIEAGFREHPYGLWAVEVIGGEPFIGFVGLTRQTFPAPFTPCVEVGWRLAKTAWGHGYASEAARASLAHGFDVVGLDEILSFTTVRNERSQAVMRRIGMVRDPSLDFEHPRVPVGSPIRPHVVYRIRRAT